MPKNVVDDSFNVFVSATPTTPHKDFVGSELVVVTPDREGVDEGDSSTCSDLSG